MPLRVGDLERIGGTDALPVWRKELNFERVLNGQNSWLEVLGISSPSLSRAMDRPSRCRA